ncbi:MAG: SMC-Scp complex subunit ScpB [Acidobacteriota bacterium]
MTPEELRCTIEAIFFVAGEPVTLESLAEAFADEGKEAVLAQIEAIRLRFGEESGFILETAGGGYRFATRPAFDPALRKFFSRQGEHRLSIAALETMSIVAYRQPVTAPEVSEIRGVNSSGVLRTLLERRLIRIAGRKAVVGSPFLYRTTREFLLHFGLEDIQDLPSLEDYGELLGDVALGALLEPVDNPGNSLAGIEENAAGNDAFKYAADGELLSASKSADSDGASIPRAEALAAEEDDRPGDVQTGVLEPDETATGRIEMNEERDESSENRRPLVNSDTALPDGGAERDEEWDRTRSDSLQDSSSLADDDEDPMPEDEEKR